MKSCTIVKETKIREISSRERSQCKKLLVSYTSFRHQSEASKLSERIEKIFWKLVELAPRIKKARLVALAGFIGEMYHFHQEYPQPTYTEDRIEAEMVAMPAKWLTLTLECRAVPILRFISKKKHETLESAQGKNKRRILRLFKKYGGIVKHL